MRKIAFGLLAIPAYVFANVGGCGPLADDPVLDGGASGGEGGTPAGGDDSGSGASHDAGQASSHDAGSQGGGDGSTAAMPEAATSDDSGDDSAVVPPNDAAQMTCSKAGAAWVAGAGISQTGWTATATATASNDGNAGDSTPGSAFDGNITTRWSDGVAQAGGEFFRLDLGSSMSFSQVVLFLGGTDTTDFPAEYTLSVSTDDSTYTPVASGSGANPTAICFPTQTAQYIKITQTGTSGSWFSIYEINVFP